MVAKLPEKAKSFPKFSRNENISLVEETFGKFWP